MPNIVVKNFLDILMIKYNSNQHKSNKFYYMYIIKRLRIEAAKLFANGNIYDHLVNVAYTLSRLSTAFEEVNNLSKTFFSYGIDNGYIHFVIHDVEGTAITLVIKLYDPERKINVKKVSAKGKLLVSNHTIASELNNEPLDKELEIYIRESLIEYTQYIIDKL